jgi:hypothetical protein
MLWVSGRQCWLSGMLLSYNDRETVSPDIFQEDLASAHFRGGLSAIEAREVIDIRRRKPAWTPSYERLKPSPVNGRSLSSAWARSDTRGLSTVARHGI